MLTTSGNPPGLHSLIVSQVRDRAQEYRVLDFKFIGQQSERCLHRGEGVDLPDRVIIQDEAVSVMLLHSVPGFHGLEVQLD